MSKVVECLSLFMKRTVTPYTFVYGIYMEYNEEEVIYEEMEIKMSKTL